MPLEYTEPGLISGFTSPVLLHCSVFPGRCDWTSPFSSCHSSFLSFFGSAGLTASQRRCTFYSASLSLPLYPTTPAGLRFCFNPNSYGEAPLQTCCILLIIIIINPSEHHFGKTSLSFSGVPSPLCPYLSRRVVNQGRGRRGGSRRTRCAVMDSAGVTTLKNKPINQPESCRKAPPTPAISQDDGHLLTPP